MPVLLLRQAVGSGRQDPMQKIICHNLTRSIATTHQVFDQDHSLLQQTQDEAVSALLKTNLWPRKSSFGIRMRKSRNDLHSGGSSCRNPNARRSVRGRYF